MKYATLETNLEEHTYAVYIDTHPEIFLDVLDAALAPQK